VSVDPRIAIVGAGRFASCLARALRQSNYIIVEIISRESTGSRRRARTLAARVGARATTVTAGAIDAELLWFCVPDNQIRGSAEALAKRECASLRLAFHSSGAVESGELEALHKLGIAVASVHPLMTFVAGARPALAGVPFAIEGDALAVRAARTIVHRLGGKGFVLAANRKPAYHAWATMTSPLLVAYLVAMEDTARAAGLTRAEARRMSTPIVRQTFENYARMGAAKSFSGPFIRGDTETVAKHLDLLKSNPKIRAAYVALARVAVDGLPVKNRRQLLGLLKG